MAAKNTIRSPIAKLLGQMIVDGTLPSGIPEDVLDELREDQKRLCVLYRDTLFDDFLAGVLRRHFSQWDNVVKKLFDPSIGGPLVSLTHKARLAYALGLIDNITQNDYEQIHKIRNEFAHNMEMSFADAKVLAHVRKLSTAKGHNKVTAKNSYELYDRATHICVDGFTDTFEKVA